MTEVRRNINKLIDEIDLLRPLVLTEEQENAEVRSLLRRMFYRLENIKQYPFISAVRYQKIVKLLATLLDAEHGALIKGSAEVPLSDEDIEPCSAEEVLNSIQKLRTQLHQHTGEAADELHQADASVVEESLPELFRLFWRQK